MQLVALHCPSPPIYSEEQKCNKTDFFCSIDYIIVHIGCIVRAHKSNNSLVATNYFSCGLLQYLQCLIQSLLCICDQVFLQAKDKHEQVHFFILSLIHLLSYHVVESVMR